jgi:hypothetical protein
VSGALRLRRFEGRYAICRLEREAEIPDWARGDLVATVRTPAELAVICDEAEVPEHVTAEGGWCCYELGGPYPFDAIGVLSAVLAPLRDAGVSILALSSYETDYVLVPWGAEAEAQAALEGAGHAVER